MRLAVISDIHGNMDAFSMVLKNIDTSSVDAIISLGDNIGYGAEPEAVIKTLSQRKIPSIMGNHEMAMLNKKHRRWFNALACKALVKNERLLSDKSIQFIRKLKIFMQIYGAYFVHGTPPDSATTYIFKVSEKSLPAIFRQVNLKVCFIGHTHKLQTIAYNGKDLVKEELLEGVITLSDDCNYIINVGSVGQPRDDNSDAKYIIWDSNINTIEAKFISYDIDMAAAKILKAGIPKKFARQLYRKDRI